MAQAARNRIIASTLVTLLVAVSLSPLASAQQGGGNVGSTFELCRNGGQGDPPTLAQCLVQGGSTGYGSGQSNEKQAHFREGDFVPVRLALTGLPLNTAQWVDIEYVTLAGASKHGFDYPGSFDATETTGAPSLYNANGNNPCSNLGTTLCTPATPRSTFPFPAPTLNNFPAASGGNTWTNLLTQLDANGKLPASPGRMALWGSSGAVITNVEFRAENVACGGGNHCSTFRVYFNPGAGQSIVLAFGMHVASQVDWGKGASSINGGSYQVRTSGASFGNVGGSLNIAVGAVRSASVLVVEKTARGADASFPFTATRAGDYTGLPGSFAVQTTGGSGSRSYLLLAGSTYQYSITEVAPSVPWDFNSLACTSTQTGTSVTLDQVLRTASFVIDAAEVLNCKYTNTHRARIVVQQVTDPIGASQSFGYTGSLGSFSLTSGTSVTSAWLVPGSGYAVTQGSPLPKGWILASATCSNGNAPGAITLAAGQTVTCTFTNREVQQLPTTLLVDAASGVFGGSATLRATLTASGNPVEGKSVSFTMLGAPAGTATTDASGVASLPVSLAGINAGSYPGAITASFAGDNDHEPASGSNALTVAKAPQTITFAAIDDKTYQQVFSVSPTASSGLPVALAIAGPCSLSGTTVTVDSGTGTCTLTASQGGNGNFLAADDVARAFGLLKKTQTVTLAAIADQTYGATFQVSAAATSGLGVVYTVSGPCSLSGTTLTVQSGTGTCTVTATQAGNDDWQSASDAETFGLERKAQVVTLDAIGTKTFGDTFDASGSATSGLAVTYSIVEGPCSISGATITVESGTGECIVKASQAGNDNWLPAETTATFLLRKKAHSVTLNMIDPKVYGSVFDVSGASDADLELVYTIESGPCTIDGKTVTVNSGTGSCIVKASHPGNDDYQAASATREFTLQKATQTVTLEPIPGKTYGDMFGVSATASSQLPVEYFVTAGPCSISGATVTATSGTGSCTVEARQAGDDNYNPASDAETFSLSKKAQTVVLAPIGARIYGDELTLSATTTSPLTVSFELVDGPCDLSGATLTVDSGTGTCTVKAVQSGDDNWAPASDDETFELGRKAQTVTLSSITDKTFGETFDASGSATSGLAVVYTIVEGPCAIDGASVTVNSGTGACTVRATQAGDLNWLPASDDEEFTLLKKTTTVALDPVPQQTAGDTVTLSATTSSGLPITYSVVDGPCSIDGAVVTILSGVGTCTVKASVAGNDDWSDGSDEKTFSLAKKAQTVVLDAIGTTTYLDSVVASATATSGLPVTYAVVGGPCGIVGATVTANSGTGSCTVKATQEGNDFYAAASDSKTFGLAKRPQTVTLEEIADKTYGDVFDVSATATSGGAITYTVFAGLCSVDGASVTVGSGMGTCVIMATQAGNDNWASATDTQEFGLKKKAQTVSIQPIGAKTYGSSFEIEGSATSGLPVTYSVVSGPCTLDGSTLTVTSGSGKCVVKAIQAGNDNYEPAEQEIEFSLQKATQTVDLDAIPTKVFESVFTVSATATSGRPLTYAVTFGPCTIDGTTVTVQSGTGTCTVKATQAGDDDYEPASDSETFDLAKKAQTVVLETIASQVFEATVDASATATSGMPVTYAVTSGPCSIDGATVTVHSGTGSCTVEATQAGNDDWESASDSKTFALGKKAQTVTLEEIGTKIFGDSFDASATASSGLGVTYEIVDGPCTIVGATITVQSGTGECVVKATQAGNDDHLPASDTKTFALAKKAQTVTLNMITPKTFGATFDLSATSSAGLPITYTIVEGPCTIDGATVTVNSGTGDCVVKASSEGDADHEAASDTKTFSLQKRSQVLDLAAIADKPYQSVFGVSATTTSGLAITYTVEGPCSIDGVTVTVLSGTGSCTVTASQDGDANWNPASDSEGFDLQKLPQTVTVDAIADQVYLSSFETGASATSGLEPIVYEITAGPCTIAGSTVTVNSGTGACTVTATQAGDDNYESASGSATFALLKKAQVVALDAITTKVYGTVFSASATATSGLAVTYEIVDGPCSISGATITVQSGTGECVVKATQAGDHGWAAADDSETFLLAKKAQTVQLGSIGTRTYGDSFTLTATATSGLPVTFAVLDGPCDLSGAVLTVESGVGACTVEASQAGDDNHLPASDDTTFSLQKKAQTISLVTPATKTYGDADFPLTATAASGLPVTLTASGACSIEDGIVKLLSAGTCTIVATQGGGDNWAAAPTLTRTISVAAAATGVSGLVASLTGVVAQFSDTISLTATVAPSTTATGDGAFAGTLTFRVNGNPSLGVSVPVTHLEPTRTVQIRLDQTIIPVGAGTYAVTAAFTPASGSNYAGSVETASLKVIPEGAKPLSGGLLAMQDSTNVEYIGDQFVVVGGAPNLLALLSQSLGPDELDGEFVDYERVPVSLRFRVYPGGTSCSTSCNDAPIFERVVRVDNRVDFSTGEGYAQVAGPKLNEGSYQVVVSLEANGYIVSNVGGATFVVAAATGQFITGGGHMAQDPKAMESGVANKKANFGFGIKQTNKNLQGNSIYVFRVRMDVAASTPAALAYCWETSETCRDVDVIIKSNRLTALSTSTGTGFPRTGFATGQMSVQFVDAADGSTHYTRFEFGAGTWRLDITDGGPSNQNVDQYGFSAYRKDGSLFHQAVLGPLAQRGTSSATNQALLGNGNVAVQPSSGGK